MKILGIPESKINTALCILLMPLLSLQGCSLLFPSPPPVQVVEEEKPVDQAGVEPENPLLLSINNEVSDGDKLFIKGSIHARTSWDLANVLIHLSSLKGGNVVGEAYYPLRTLQEGPEKKSVLNACEDLHLSI